MEARRRFLRHRELRAVVAVLGAALVVLTAGNASAAFEFRWPTAREAALLNAWPDAGGRPPGAASLGEDARGRRPDRVILSAGRLYGLGEARGWGARAEPHVLGRTLTLDLSSFGGEVYGERTLSVSVGGAARGRPGVGVTVRALGIDAGGLDDLWTFALDAEVVTVLAARLVVGARCENLTASRIGGSPVPTRAHAGAVLVLPGASLHVSALLEDGFDVRNTLACETRVCDWLRARAAASANPGRFSVGFGFGREDETRWPVLDVAWQWHPELGGSSFASVSFALPRHRDTPGGSGRGDTVSGARRRRVCRRCSR